MGDYEINGNEILTPTTFRWIPRQPIDVQGDNRPIYSGVRGAELRWQLASYEDWAALQYQFDQVQSTGSATVRIPEYPTATGSAYAFREYSGVHLAEPSIGEFFVEHPTSVVLILGNIIVE
jgi:hypothetical protein